MKIDEGDHPDATWERGWSGHERAQLRRLATLSLTEKLRWLEEAHELVRHLSEQNTRSRAVPDDSSEPPR